jgi:RNA polymerase sigma factor (sigma-70 family)
MGAIVIRSDARLQEQNERIAAIVSKQRSQLLAFVRRQIGDALDAEEIVQDVFFELTEAYRLTRPIEHMAGWLMRVARNRVIDRFRKRRRESGSPASAAFPDSAGDPPVDEVTGLLDSLKLPDAWGPESAYHRDVLLDAIGAALAELPADQRETFVEHELQGLSMREIADRQRVPVNTVLGRKHSAVLHLRSRLRVLYDDLPD